MPSCNIAAILISLILCFCSGNCASSTQKQPDESDKAPQVKENRYGKNILFGKVKWGMSKARVRQSERFSFIDDGDVLTTKQLQKALGYKCHILYYFKDDKFYKGGYICPIELPAKVHIQVFEKLKSQFATTYGQASEWFEYESDSVKKLVQDTPELYEEAFNMSQLRLHAEWKFTDYIISAAAGIKNYQGYISVHVENLLIQ